MNTEIKHFHLFCGLGGGARGFNRGRAQVGTMTATFRCIGGIDNDPAAVADFGRLAGVPATLLDLFDRSQYVAFHGHQPPADWREALPADIQRAAGGEAPNVVFLSPPCKGFSGLLSETRSRTEKYQALNRLTLRGIWLTLEAFKDDPAEFYLLENVPRIANRGRPLLDQIVQLLEAYGYAVRESTHDCGELGGLAQTRKRFLLVARHREKMPPFLYEPVKRSLRAVGDVLDRFPLPGFTQAGPMHRLPALHWKTWVRLAFVEAGSDWRSLQKLRVVDGKLADYLIVPDMHGGVLGVAGWDETSHTITGNARPVTGKFAVSDPRIDGHPRSVQNGVLDWQDTAGVVTGKMHVGGGAHAIADPRIEGAPRFNTTYRIVRWDQPSQAVAGPGGPAGGLALADPRVGYSDRSPNWNKLSVAHWDEACKTVTGANQPQRGALSVADPRPKIDATKRAAYLTGGHFGVVPWDQHSNVVSGVARHDNGFNSVADPRPLPQASDRLVCVIRALDGTWHRPFTTLELAALQSLVDPEEYLELQGLSDSAWRERIGNAVPPMAAEAIAGVIGTTYLLARAGETFTLSATPVWVRNVAVALALDERRPV